MDTFLVLGANSRLASSLKSVLPDNSIYLNRHQCNISSKESLQKVFKKYIFHYIINCAAITDLNFCEQNQKECLDTNALAVYTLSQLCQEYKRKLIHISSDYAVNPMNAYGASKYISENLVDESALVMRTNFYDKHTYIINALLSSKQIEAYDNVQFNPISINRLAEEIGRYRNKKGIINIFSSKKLTYYAFALHVCKVFSLDASLVRKITFHNERPPYRPLSSFVKPDINVEIDQDLALFKKYISYGN